VTCAEARERMLEADRTDLSGATDSALSLHLRTCARCRRAADRILEAERELWEALSAAAPGRPVDEAVGPARRRARRRRWMWRAAPLAAAAVLAVALIARREQGHQALPPASAPAIRSGLAVEGPPGRSVAVFQTDNPDIVVIWFF
jgi:hypothetical protein